MSETPCAATIVLSSLGFSVPDPDTPPGSTFAASAVGGLIVAAIFYFMGATPISILILGLAVIHGGIRELLRMRATKKAEAATPKKKRKKK